MDEKEMTRAQWLLKAYCRQEKLSCRIADGCNAIAQYGDGTKRRLTVNAFGDIMDADAKKVIATGNVPHTLNGPIRLPTHWENIRTSKPQKSERKKSSILERLWENQAEIARRDAIKNSVHKIREPERGL